MRLCNLSRIKQILLPSFIIMFRILIKHSVTKSISVSSLYKLSKVNHNLFNNTRFHNWKEIRKRNCVVLYFLFTSCGKNSMNSMFEVETAAAPCSKRLDILDINLNARHSNWTSCSFCCFTSLNNTSTKTNMVDENKTFIPIFRRWRRFLCIALLRSYIVTCYSLSYVSRKMYEYKNVPLCIHISMGLLRSICVLHVKSKRRRRYNAVMHPRSSFT